MLLTWGYRTTATGLPHIPRMTWGIWWPARLPMTTTDESGGIAAHRRFTAGISPDEFLLTAGPGAPALTPSGPPTLIPRPKVATAGGTSSSAAQKAARAPPATR